MLARSYSPRQLLLAVILFGTVGLAAELLLIEHYEDLEQFIPVGMLAIGFVAAVLVWRRPSPRVLRGYRIIMALYVVVGLVGMFFHIRGNMEFALERDPALTGLRLAWKALAGASPTLAAGAIAQLGLLGLIHAYHHPASPSVQDAMPHEFDQENSI